MARWCCTFVMRWCVFVAVYELRMTYWLNQLFIMLKLMPHWKGFVFLVLFPLSKAHTVHSETIMWKPLCFPHNGECLSPQYASFFWKPMRWNKCWISQYQQLTVCSPSCSWICIIQRLACTMFDSYYNSVVHSLLIDSKPLRHEETSFLLWCLIKATVAALSTFHFQGLFMRIFLSSLSLFSIMFLCLDFCVFVSCVSWPHRVLIQSLQLFQSRYLSACLWNLTVLVSR